MSPKISIVVPIKQYSEYLEDTLSSALTQSLKDIELICMNGAHDTKICSALKTAIDNDPRVKVIDLNTKEEGVLYNTGLETATGEYIHFLMPGDQILNFAYEALYNKVQRYDLDYLHFVTAPYVRNKKQILNIESFTLENLHPNDFNHLLNLDVESLLYRLNNSVWTGLYRRAFLREHHIDFGCNPTQIEQFFHWNLVACKPRAAISRDCLLLHTIVDCKTLESNNVLHTVKEQLKAIEALRNKLSQRNVADDITAVALCNSIGDCIECVQHNTIEESSFREVRTILASYIKTLPGTLWNPTFKLLKIAQQNITDGNSPKQISHEAMPFFHAESTHPKVSIVVPIHNQEEYLNQSLHSLTTQSLEDLEFLCINNDASEQSLAIYNEYAAIDKRFRLFSKLDTSLGDSINLCIQNARGKYLSILKSIDYVLPEMYERFYSIANRKSLDFIKGNFYRFTTDMNGTECLRLRHLSDDNSYYGSIVNTSTDDRTFSFAMGTCSSIYSMNFLKRWHIQYSRSSEDILQDDAFCFQILARATRAQFIKTPFYMSRCDNSASSFTSSDKIHAIAQEYEYIYNWLHSKPNLYERYETIYWYKKLDNAYSTYLQIPLAAKTEYAKRIYDEFAKPFVQGKISRQLSGEVRWKFLAELIDNPKAFAKKIRISIIMPIYNAERYLHETLDCLVHQLNNSAELICVDDGSTDSTSKILAEYADRFEQFTVITQKNTGAGAARNVGMAYAHGEYLMFLDCDDIYEPDLIRTAYETAYSQQSDVVVFNSNDYFEDTHVYRKTKGNIRTELLPAECPFNSKDIYYDVFRAFIGWPWDKLFRADFIRANGIKFQEQRTTNDLLFVFSAIIRAERISTINTVLAHHRRASDSLSVTREKSWYCFYNALIALREKLQEWEVWERYEQDFINYALHFSLWNLNTLYGETYGMLFNLLKNKWFKNLGIVDKPASYFYHPDDYESYRYICDNDASLYTSRRIGLLLEKNREKTDSINEIRGISKKIRKQFDATNSQLERIRSTSTFKLGTKLLSLGYNLRLIKH